MLLTGLQPMALLAYFLTHQDHLPRVGITHNGLGPRPSITKKIDHSHIFRPILFSFFFSFLPFLFFKTGFPCVTALTVLELALVDQAGLELTKIRRSA